MNANKITKNQINKVSEECRLSNNMIFVLADMIEQLCVLSEEEMKKHNIKFDAKTQNAFNFIKWGSKDIRSRTTEISMSDQISFSEESNMLLELFVRTLIATGDSNNVFNIILNFVKSFQPQMEINLRKFGI